MSKPVIEEVLLTDSEKETLELLASQYDEAVSEYNASEAKKKALNGILKNTMADFGVTKFTSSSGISLSVSTTPNVSYDEDVLLRIIKKLGVPGIIKTKEYVDIEAMESALYHNTIQKDDIKEGIIVKPDTIKLNCRKKKILNE